jgi:hypothetical protein
MLEDDQEQVTSRAPARLSALSVGGAAAAT